VAASGGDFGQGVIYKLNKDGTGYKVLHHFSGPPQDGQPGEGAGGAGNYPPYGENSLLAASDGAIYGTTSEGGALSEGTAFRINPDGTGYAVIYHFGQPDTDGFHDYGRSPLGGLLQGGGGALYGAAAYGGFGDTKDGDGVIFRMNTDGTGYAILHNFSSDNGDLMFPQATLLRGSDGALYGATDAGGPADSGGVFSLSEDGTAYTILHTFTASASVGDSHRLLEGRDGFLYGTTERDGTSLTTANYGTVYRLNKDGSGYSILHEFGIDSQDGAYPDAGLVKDSAGFMYGSTTVGGAGGGGGIVYKLWPVETPDMVRVTPSGSATQVTFTGTGSYQYQVLRSTNLTDWAPLATVTMPAFGIYTYLDTTPPPHNAFYRAAWAP
jgi:uncharacterized repeat protein (TIGR03803 family)